MKRHLLAALLASALVPLAGAPAWAQPGPTAAASTAVVPPVPFRERTLRNGLHVFTALDRSTPNVTVQVWYGVGSKDDPQGRSGFAHLFEHMMFKATRDMPAEEMDRLTEDVGGANNASTWDDLTNYFEIIPANHLQRLLWAEAERMSSLVVDDANFRSERDVVKEELRQRVLADPYGRFFTLYIPTHSYTVHPYKRPGIGSIEDLDAATLPDVRAFHTTFYRPDDANLIVIGNFDPAQLDAWIDRYFGDIGNPSVPIPQVTAVEPPRAGPTSFTGYGPNVPLPALALTFLIPAAASPDLAPLQVADAILSTGKSSRLYRDLVYQQQIAQTAFSDAGRNQQPGLFYAGAIMAEGHTLDEGEAALRAELRRLRDAPVTAEELARAKNQLVSQALEERETIMGRAAELGQAILLEGDPRRVNTDIAALQAVTAADVQRVARLYLADDKRATIRYLPESARPAGAAATSASALASPTVAAAPEPAAPQAVPPPESLPHTPPPVGPAVSSTAPRLSERTLPNGLRVIVAKTSDLPLVTAELTVKSGSGLDPHGLAGLQGMTAKLLTEGTQTRTAPEIASEVEALGGSLGSGAGADESHLVLTVLADQTPRALPIMADVARHPAFAPAEIARQRKQTLDALAVALTEPGSLARKVLAPVVLGGTAYGQTTTPASIRRITREEILRQYGETFRPDNAILVLTGDISPEEGFALAARNFGDWTRPATPLPQPAPVRSAAKPRVLVIDLPGAGQAAVTLAARSIPRNDPRYYQVEAINGVLGGGYSARLNEEIRVKRGLSYGADSNIDERRDTGVFLASAQTKNESAPQVAELLLDQARGLSSGALTAAELDARKASLVGDFGREVERSAGLANVLTEDALYGIDVAEVGRRTAAIQAVTPDQARAAALAAVDPSRASLVIVGDGKLFLAKLRERFPNAEVIPAADLDLDSPTLRKGR